MGRTVAGWHRLRISLGLAVLLLAASSPLVASADSYGVGPPDAGYRPSTLARTYCYESSVTSTYKSLFGLATQYATSATIFSYTVKSTCPGPNVRVQLSTTLGAGVRGDYACTSLTSQSRCWLSRIRFNPNLLTNTINRHKTACHELGHELGLRHGGTADCMINGVVTQSYTTYSTHHLNHINGGTNPP